MPKNQITASVIVPAYNAETTMNKLLDSLVNLDFPKDKYEIIIVDNNSIDKTREIVKKYPVTLIEQKKIQSSYASRNLGIKKSKGEILAFSDADCIVDKDWLKNAVKALKENPIIDIIGGKVIFLSGKDNTFSYFDRNHHLNQHRYCCEGWCLTANLITKKKTFDKIGLFGDYFSGGDFEWSRRATQKGLKLRYFYNIIVYHKTRDTFRGLIEKRLKAGYGKAELVKQKRLLTIGQRMFKILSFSDIRKWIGKELTVEKISLITFFNVIALERVLKLYEFKGFIMGLRNKDLIRTLKTQLAKHKNIGKNTKFSF